MTNTILGAARTLVARLPFGPRPAPAPAVRPTGGSRPGPVWAERRIPPPAGRGAAGRTLGAALLAVGLLDGCDGSRSGGSGAGGAAGTGPAASEPVATGPRLENFAAAKFSDPTRIDNPWMPMTPGMRYTFDGTTIEDDGTPLPHQIVIHVTDLTKVIAGVRTLVSWDLDYSDGALAEAELAFYAQDDEGNVWRMGEYPEEYEEGKRIANPAWLHGIEEASAGIMMKASPALGTDSYSQGWGPAVDWTDRGRVDSMGVVTCVPVRCYEDVLVVAETSRSEPDAEQLKYYARGVGNVRVGWRGAGEKTRETLELSKVETLDARGLAKVRDEALALEKSAYQNSPGVYAGTAPAERASAGR